MAAFKPGTEDLTALLTSQYGKDGYHLLDAMRAPGAPAWLRELPAVRALRAIWAKQYYRDIGAGGDRCLQQGCCASPPLVELVTGELVTDDGLH